jgi:hypothetical protein
MELQLIDGTHCIHVDMDNAPGEDFFHKEDNSTILSDDDDAFFVVEQIGVLSQYFMAASPKHPLMYLSVHQVFTRLLETNIIGTQYVPFVTGPGALKNAYIRFMGQNTDGTVREGRYVSPGNNRSVTVVGSKRHSNQYVRRGSVKQIHKKRGYTLMGMKHFSRSEDPSLNISCYLHLYNVANNITMV